MTEEQRQEWNAAVAAARTDPSAENLARRDALRGEILNGIHLKIMTEDRYQERTHDLQGTA